MALIALLFVSAIVALVAGLVLAATTEDALNTQGRERT
jgi:hypothetical protein